MALSKDLISQFAKVVNNAESKPKTETSAYGTVKKIRDSTYVKIDGSDLLTPVKTETVDTDDDDRVLVSIKNHSVSITGNSTRPAANTKYVNEQIAQTNLLVVDKVDTEDFEAETAKIADLQADNVDIKNSLSTLEQTADGLSVRIDSTREDLESDITDAAKTATNFLSYDSTGGLHVGNKTSGSWRGFRIQITSAAFNILNAAGTILASYGEKLIELGKNATDAIIKFCGGKGQIEYDSDDDYLQLTADNVRLKGTEMASLYSNYTDSYGIFRNGAVHAAPGEVQITAGGGSDNSNVHVNPTNIHMTTENFYISGVMNDSDNGGIYVSATEGNSGIWTYRKYSNGDVELWGTYWITDLACTTTLGSMYCTIVFVPDQFPFAVYDANLTASYESSGYGAMLWATTSTTNYYPPNYYLIRPVSGTITSGKINFHVYGKWKT